jgi:DNA-binding SARP family transcriptional activator
MSSTLPNGPEFSRQPTSWSERFELLKSIRDIQALKQDGDSSWVPEIKAFIEQEKRKSYEEGFKAAMKREIFKATTNGSE